MTSTNIAQALELAVQHHRAGRLQKAKAIYRQILSASPDHPDALHLLGLIAHQLGRNDVALELIRQAIAVKPDFSEAYGNLGLILKAQGHLDQAIAAYRQAIALNPGCAEAHDYLGYALWQNGQLEEAIAASRQAVSLKANFPDALLHLGVFLREDGQLDAAIAAFRSATQLKPDYAEAYNVLGATLSLQGHSDPAVAALRQAITLKSDFAEAHVNLARILRSTHPEEATREYEQALRLRPDAQSWRFELAAHRGDNSSRSAPPEFVRSLFDIYAPDFEKHLVQDLQYRVPQELLSAVLAAAPGRLFDAIDLGCGTGLCGLHVRPYCRSLVGVDLSAGMIQAATSRQIYDRLDLADILEPLRAHPAGYDLVLAGDVLIYVGDLAEVMPAVSQSLRPGGLFAFSIENHDGTGFVLTPARRFAHSLNYIRQTAAASCLTEISTRQLVLRKEGVNDMPGWIVVLSNARQARAISGEMI